MYASYYITYTEFADQLLISAMPVLITQLINHIEKSLSIMGSVL